MTQAEKMQLRMIAILDQSKVSWGDLANTINSPSNMLRQFSNNAKELSMVFGQLFIPVLQKVMPVLNGVTIALKRLLVSFAQMLGIKIDFDAFGQGYSDMSDGAEDLSDGLDDVATSAKKANAGLRAFDELKVINMPDASDKGGAGGGAAIDLTDEIVKATEEYEKVWNEAFAQMENTAQAWADNIEKALEPVKKIFQDFAIGDFFQAGKDTSAIVISITDFFAKAIADVDWYGMGQKIGGFLAGIDWIGILSSIGNLIWQGINAGIELWSGSFSTAPIETAILSAIIALPALSPIITPLASSISEMFSLWAGGAGTLGESFMAVFGAGGVIAVALTALAAGLGYIYSTNEDVRESFNNSINSIKGGLQPALEFITNTILPNLNAGWERFLEILTPIGEFLEGAFISMWQDMINPTLTYIGDTVLPMLTNAFENLWNNVLVPIGDFLGNIFAPIIRLISGIFTTLWKDAVVPVTEAVGNELKAAFEGVMGFIDNKIMPTISGVIGVLQFLFNDVLSPLANFLTDVFLAVFKTTFKIIGNSIKNAGKIFSGLIEFILGVFSGEWLKAWQGVGDIFTGVWNNFKNIAQTTLEAIISLFNKGGKIFDGFVNGVADVFKSIVRDIIKGINSVISIPFEKINKLLNDIRKISILGVKPFEGLWGENPLPIPQIPQFKKGGLVLNHMFAEIGEYNKPEAVLPLTNSKTMGMIADSIFENANYNNYSNGYGDDYIRQIEEATYRGTMRAIQAAGGIKAEATFKVENDRDSIFKITQEMASDYFRRTGNAAYDF